MTQPSAAVDGAGVLASDDDDAGTRLGVTALLVVQQAREAWLDRTLTALAGQRRRPDRLVVIDATADRTVADRIADDPRIQGAFSGVSVVTVPSGTPFAAVIDTAVDALPEPGEDVVVARRPRRRARAHKIRPRDRHEWLWLLHEDSAPEPDALDRLVQVVSQSGRIGIAGCKITAFDDPGRLVGVGIDLTRAGRHVGAGMAGEPDQGQYDHRRDVLAVSSAGMLVRRDVYTRLGGFDPSFDGDGDGLDLCWRAHLSSQQVVVVPAATCHQDLTATSGTYAASDRPAPRGARTLRRHRQVALARASLLGLPLMACWIAAGCALLAAMFLVLKRPRRAATEFAQATAPCGVVRIVGARWRFFGRSSARRRNLRSLFVPVSAAARSAGESLHDALSGDDLPEEGDVVDTDDAVAPRRWRHTLANPGFWAVLVLVAASVVMWRDLVTTSAFRGGGHGLAGGELQPFATDAQGVWRMWRDGWQGPGLGHGPVAVAYLPVLAGLTWLVQWIPGVVDATAGATTIAYLLAACMPLSGAAAYRAARVVTRARWPRAAAALAWASLATMTTAVSAGRLGPAVAHVLLPFAVAGVFAIARRGAGVSTLFGTVLVTAMLGAFAPPLLVLVAVMALVVVIVGPGWARLRGLVLAGLPWLLIAPWTRSLWREDWRALLVAPGGLEPAHTATPEPWQLALLHPGGPGSYLVLISAPILVCGVLGMLRPGRARAQAALVALALVGLAGGLVASHVRVLDGAQGAQIPWSGTALDVLALALLAAALLGSRPADAPEARSASSQGDDGADGPDESGAASRPHRGRKAALPIGIAAACLIALGMTGTAVWTAPVDALRPADPAFTGIVDGPVHGNRAVRVLDLDVASSGAVSYALRGQETGLPVRGMPMPSADDASTSEAVSALLTRGGPDGGSSPARALHALAVYAVVVHGDAADTRTLRQSLQATGVLTPLGEGGRTTVWRAAPLEVRDGARSVDPSRVTLYADGEPVREVSSRIAHGRTSVVIPSGTSARAIVLSEGTGWRHLGRVSLDGHPLARTTIDGMPAYRLGADGGRLTIDPGTAFYRVRWLQLGLLVVVVFLAVPFGNRRSRRAA